MDDDTGADLPTAPGDPGADATGRPGHQRDASAEVQELRDGRRSFGHRGSGFGPVAVTSRARPVADDVAVRCAECARTVDEPTVEREGWTYSLRRPADG